jgi:hypothetical protein
VANGILSIKECLSFSLIVKCEIPGLTSLHSTLLEQGGCRIADEKVEFELELVTAMNQVTSSVTAVLGGLVPSYLD